MIYLLDTNVIAELTTRQKPRSGCPRLVRSTPRPNRYLSVLTIAEIEMGVRATPDVQRRAHYARALAEIRDEYRDRIAPVHEPESIAYLTVHKRLRKSGAGIDPPDALIAATAPANGWTLASRNVKHLARTGALLVNPWDPPQ